MGVADWFETFNSNLRMTKTTTDAISIRYKAMTTRINLDFWNITSETQHSLYVGSYGRALRQKLKKVTNYHWKPLHMSKKNQKKNGLQSKSGGKFIWDAGTGLLSLKNQNRSYPS